VKRRIASENKKMKKQIYNYGIDVDKETLEQFKNCYSEDFVVAAALMPDAHLGYAAPIGAVLKTKKFIVPAWVGFDIGCGLIAIKIKSEGLVGKIRENQNKIYSQVMKKIPMGVGNYNEIKNITEKTKKTFKDLLEKFEKIVPWKKYCSPKCKQIAWALRGVPVAACASRRFSRVLFPRPLSS